MKPLTLCVALLMVAAAVALLLAGMGEDAPDLPQLMRDARRAQRRGDPAGIQKATDAVLKLEPRNVEARMLAAEAATRLEQLDDAVAHYDKIPADSDRYVEARWAAGDLLLFLGKSRAAERAFRAALSVAPDTPRANSKLAILLGAQGRRWESLPYLMQRVRSGQLQPEPDPNRPIPLELLYAASLENLVDLDQAERFLKVAPEYHVPHIARGRAMLKQNERASAEAEFRRVVSQDAGQVEAQAQLGLLLVGRADDFRQWAEALPSEADSHPDTWFARGLQARESGQVQAAVRCFGEAARLDPDNPRANHQLGQVLVEIGEREHAEQFIARDRQLGELQAQIDLVFHEQTNQDLVRTIAENMQQLGRAWEAVEWYRVLARLNPGDPTAGERARMLRLTVRGVEPATSRTVATLSPAEKLDLSRFPLPQWSSGSGTPVHVASQSRVQFDEKSAELGIDFRYFNSGDPETPGRLMFEYTGGGVGVIDFDLDLWPDLYFTQGREWPVDAKTSAYHNRLFRNPGPGKPYEEVAVLSGTDDRGFGQGVAVGDIDGDGFPDLYVANIGRNTLLRNNGDGTFTDITDRMLDPVGRWTTSCLIADLDGDGLPDLYDVNYLTGDDIFEKMCPWGSDTLRACTPTQYAGEQDQAYRNDGTGSFIRSTTEWGLNVEDGKGLGVLAADLDGSGSLDLFVANDMVPNWCFLNGSNTAGAPDFFESGIASGVGVDRDGRAQGCMGIAAGDADHDGLLDLFVTNFYDESNTLYLRRPDGLFSDRSIAAGLREPGYRQLGFGTQFIDAELDGRPDLVVTNGHIDDFEFEGKPHFMPPHYYRNIGGGQFQHIEGAGAGEFFGGRYLGRGLARFDLNRDGREEFAVSHLDGPAAVLMNSTPDPGAGLVVHLRGTESERDAVGTVVTITGDNGRRLTGQLTAGDGYHASNQRTLVFGLGDQTTPVTLEVRWPSGNVERVSRVDVNSEIAVIEGLSRHLSLPH